MFSSKKLRKRLHKWCSDNLLFTKAKDYQNGTKRNKINPKGKLRVTTQHPHGELTATNAILGLSALRPKETAA